MGLDPARFACWAKGTCRIQSVIAAETARWLVRFEVSGDAPDVKFLIRHERTVTTLRFVWEL